VFVLADWWKFDNHRINLQNDAIGQVIYSIFFVSEGTDMQLREVDVTKGIELIYSSSSRPEGWTGFLAHFSKMTDCGYPSIYGHDIITNCNLGFVCERFDPSFQKSYGEYYAALNPWVPGMHTAPKGAVLLAEQLASQSSVMHSEFYADWLLEQEDIASGAAVVLHRDSTRFLAFCCNLRLRDREHIQTDLQFAMQVFSPHLRNAFSAQRHVRMSAANTILDAFQASDPSAGLIVLSVDGRVLRCNSIAEKWFREGVLAEDKVGKLKFDDAKAARALRGVLRQDTFMTEFVSRPIGLRVQKRGFPFVMFLHPVTRSDATFDLGWRDDTKSPRVVVVLRDVRADINVKLDAAVSLYELTLAERRLAIELCHGSTLSDIAEKLGVSQNTVRNQLSSVFQKTGTARQSELVLLLMKIGLH